MYANASIVQDTKKTGKRIAKVVGHDDGQYRNTDWEPLEPPNNTCHWYGYSWFYENGDA